MYARDNLISQCHFGWYELLEMSVFFGGFPSTITCVWCMVSADTKYKIQIHKIQIHKYKSNLCVWVWFQQTGEVVQAGVLHKQRHPDRSDGGLDYHYSLFIKLSLFIIHLNCHYSLYSKNNVILTGVMVVVIIIIQALQICDCEFHELYTGINLKP